VDGEKVAAFAPSETQGSLERSLGLAHELLDDTRHGLYKDKVLTIVACRDKNLKRHAELIIHEEHPTVFEEEIPNGCVAPLPEGLFLAEVV